MKNANILFVLFATITAKILPYGHTMNFYAGGISIADDFGYTYNFKPIQTAGRQMNLARKFLGALPGNWTFQLVNRDPGFLQIGFSNGLRSTSIDPRIIEAPSQKWSFNRKKGFLYNRIKNHQSRIRGDRLVISISDRDNLVGEAFLQISVVSQGLKLRRELTVEFEGENGIDCGGLRKSFFHEMSKLFTPEYGLFEFSDDSNTMVELKASANFNDDVEARFRFAGRILGMSIFHQAPIDIVFGHTLLRSLIDERVKLNDLEAMDPAFYKSLNSLLYDQL